MVIGQLIASTATLFDRKTALADRESLGVPVVGWTASSRDGRWRGDDGAEYDDAGVAAALEQRSVSVMHIYGDSLPRGVLGRARIPFICSTAPRKSIFPLRNVRRPAATLPRRGAGSIEESARNVYFGTRWRGSGAATRVVGSMSRGNAADMMRELAMARVLRFRDDVDWYLFEPFPEPEQIAAVDVWVDPAADEDDLDGFVAEALSAGCPVIASRTAANEARLDGGRAGLLVRPHDPNELVHAILRALFKPESLEPLLEHARTHSLRFESSRRAAALLELYRRVAQ